MLLLFNSRYGALTAVPRLPYLKRTLANFIVETAILCFIPTTQVIGKKITSCAAGLGRTVLR